MQDQAGWCVWFALHLIEFKITFQNLPSSCALVKFWWVQWACSSVHSVLWMDPVQLKLKSGEEVSPGRQNLSNIVQIKIRETSQRLSFYSNSSTIVCFYFAQIVLLNISHCGEEGAKSKQQQQQQDSSFPPASVSTLWTNDKFCFSLIILLFFFFQHYIIPTPCVSFLVLKVNITRVCDVF